MRLLTVGDSLPRLPDGWRNDYYNFLMLLIAPDASMYFCELKNGKHILHHAHIATEDDAKRTSGRLKLNQIYIGEPFAEMELQ